MHRKPVPARPAAVFGPDTAITGSLNSSSVATSTPPVVKDDRPQSKTASPELRGPIWRTRATITMCLALAAGTLLATAHHLVYAYYSGRAVQNSIGQQWINRIGTAFAFLVKTALVIAVGSAYVQRQWYKLGTRSYRIAQVDVLFGVLGDATLFLSGLWFENGLLGLLALSCWLLPFAAIVTPGTLTVDLTPQVDMHPVQVAQHQFNYSTYAITQSIGNTYHSASTEVSRIAIATATSGQVLSIPSHYQNESYTLNFFGPAVDCFRNSTILSQMENSWATNGTMNENKLVFASWVPSDEAHAGPPWDFESNEAYETVDNTNNMGGVAPDYLTPTFPLRLFLFASDGLRPESTTESVTECVLHNASYTVDFDFTWPNQDVRLRQLALKETIITDDDQDLMSVAGSYVLSYSDPYLSNRRLSYKAIMDAFGSIFVGEATYSHYGVTIPSGGSRYSQTAVDWTNSETIQRSLEGLFHNITLGLLSSKQLVMNDTVAPFVNVSVTTYPNKYTYDAFDLWLSYGIAIGVTLLCVAFGLEAIVRNQATYSNRFSTILRTTRNSAFDDLVGENDDGSDPLPTSIGEAILLHEANRQRQGREKKSTGTKSPQFVEERLLP
ncbi:hypothetical protein CLAIMM_02158 [Cladophialophora immunda]|nr:hypothetical protein CLAIMM_02158 [Cladophialophora immunda]